MSKSVLKGIANFGPRRTLPKLDGEVNLAGYRPEPVPALRKASPKAGLFYYTRDMQTPEEKRRYQAEYRKTYRQKPLTEQQKLAKAVRARKWYLEHAEGQREKARQWRIAHPVEHAEDNRRRLAERRDKHRQMKSDRGCGRCGNSDGRVLDFHHRNPGEKLFTISNRRTLGEKTILAEIEKCDVLCANCHRIVEWEKSHAGTN
jgi:hypothetical protein